MSLAISLDENIAKSNGYVDWIKSVPNPEMMDLRFSNFCKTIDATMIGNNAYKEILGFGIPFQFLDKKTLLGLAPGSQILNMSILHKIGASC